MRFHVDVDQLTDGWRAIVDGGDECGPVLIESQSHRMVCLLAGEAMMAATDPLEKMLRAPAAPDGPKDGGGGG